MLERKTPLGWLLEKVFAQTKPKAPADLVQEHVARVRHASITELAAILAAALFAKKTLDTTRQVELPFPDKYLQGEALIDVAARAELTAYAVELEKFQAALMERNSPQSLAAARGMPTWIATLYALADPGTVPLAREIWAKLGEGREGLDEAFKFVVHRLPSDVELTYFSYAPIFLTA